MYLNGEAPEKTGQAAKAFPTRKKLNLGNFASGTYFFRLTRNRHLETRIDVRGYKTNKTLYIKFILNVTAHKLYNTEATFLNSTP